jgi:hypothetical protein
MYRLKNTIESGRIVGDVIIVIGIVIVVIRSIALCGHWPSFFLDFVTNYFFGLGGSMFFFRVSSLSRQVPILERRELALRLCMT